MNILFSCSDTRLAGNQKNIARLERLLLETNSKYTLYEHSVAHNRGVALLLNKNLNFQLTEKHIDLTGKYHGFGRGKVEQDSFLFIVVYGPNQTDHEFY